MKLALILLIVFMSLNSFGQQKLLSSEQTEIQKVIEQLFDGMRLGDSSAVHSVFSDQVRMFTNFTDEVGNPQIRQGSLEDFLTAVGTPHEEIWNEKIWNTEIKVEMNVAQVWTEYAFYVGEKFSHCGIDAFQLIKENDQWKIIHLIDTRKKMNCENPK